MRRDFYLQGNETIRKNKNVTVNLSDPRVDLSGACRFPFTSNTVTPFNERRLGVHAALKRWGAPHKVSADAEATAPRTGRGGV